MIPLNFSFESDVYHFSLLEYGRAHRRIRIEVSSSGPTCDQQKHEYLYLGMALYLPWATDWTSTQPAVASRDELWQFAQQHPRLIRSIFEPMEKFNEQIKNDPQLAQFADELDVDLAEIYKLFVFPCADEPVYIVAAYPHLQDQYYG